MDNHKDVSKLLFRANRSVVLEKVLKKGFSFPLTYDTVLHLLNHIYVRNQDLKKMEDRSLMEELDNSYGIL